MISTTQQHLTAIQHGTISKTNVIGIRKALAHVDRLRAGYSGNRSNATAEETDAIERALAAYHPSVTAELHESGLKLLRSPRWRSRFTPAQLKIIHSDHLRFDLIRFDREGRSTIVPVYRAIGFGGNFCFRNISWQSAWAEGLESGPVVVEDN